MQKVCIELMNGNKINVQLYDEIAPLTVANFMHLVDIEFYNATIFHRIIPGFMSQGGGFVIDKNTLVQTDTGYTIPGEFGSNGWVNNLSHNNGVISMARTNDPNSANSQFFICDENAKFLDGQYAAFGRVADEESLKVVKELNNIPTVALGNGFENFPNTAAENITIKCVYRV